MEREKTEQEKNVKTIVGWSLWNQIHDHLHSKQANKL